MAYPRDVYVDGDYDIAIGSDNDLRITRGFENVEQHAAIDVSDQIKEVLGGAINGTSIARLEQKIRRVLESRSYVESVIAVEATEIDRQNEEVSFDVKFVDDDDYQIFDFTLGARDTSTTVVERIQETCIQNGEVRTYESPLAVTDVFCINSGGTAEIPQEQTDCLSAGSTQRVTGTLTITETYCTAGTGIVDT